MDNGTNNNLIREWIAQLDRQVLKILLIDRTTRKNIIWATNEYMAYGAGYDAKQEITLAAILGVKGDIIRPRVMKSDRLQQQRTRKHAEVFTPSWLCNMQNNMVDAHWFGREIVFNEGKGNTWNTVATPVQFPKKSNRNWKKYVDSRRLEITCGEAPYLVSRYDTVMGADIDVSQRIGLLDRKLRIVNENANNEKDWYKWAERAFQSTYGYDFQGDNVLIARINLLLTFIDNLKFKWNRDATQEELRKIAHIVSWNVWQMDGLLGNVPYGIPEERYEQINLFTNQPEKLLLHGQPECKLNDWRWKTSLTFTSMEQQNYKGASHMKFDVVIGNPPYQDENVGDQKNYTPPIYHKFLESSYKIADVVEMIHPARFLFNAGSTPKQWNQQMLNDTHLKVLFYEPDSSKVFINTDIKGGIAITYHNLLKKFKPITTFTAFPELNSILQKTMNHDGFDSFSNIIYGRNIYRFTEKMHKDYPNAASKLSNGHAYDLSSNVFDRLPDIFFADKPSGGASYIKILGRQNNERVLKYVKRSYVGDTENIDKWKVFVPKANGTGAIGEVLSTPLIGAPLIGAPLIGATETFISIGAFETEFEAKATLKYVKSKYARTLLGVLKITQDNTSEKWKFVPMQDFTPQSDIDWSKSIKEIDRQLYKKYGLSEKEIEFIESKVKEMA